MTGGGRKVGPAASRGTRGATNPKFCARAAPAARSQTRMLRCARGGVSLPNAVSVLARHVGLSFCEAPESLLSRAGRRQHAVRFSRTLHVQPLAFQTKGGDERSVAFSHVPWASSLEVEMTCHRVLRTDRAKAFLISAGAVGRPSVAAGASSRTGRKQRAALRCAERWHEAEEGTACSHFAALAAALLRLFSGLSRGHLY